MCKGGGQSQQVAKDVVGADGQLAAKLPSKVQFRGEITRSDDWAAIGSKVKYMATDSQLILSGVLERPVKSACG